MSGHGRSPIFAGPGELSVTSKQVSADASNDQRRCAVPRFRAPGTAVRPNGWAGGPLSGGCFVKYSVAVFDPLRSTETLDIPPQRANLVLESALGSSNRHRDVSSSPAGDVPSPNLAFGSADLQRSRRGLPRLSTEVKKMWNRNVVRATVGVLSLAVISAFPAGEAEAAPSKASYNLQVGAICRGYQEKLQTIGLTISSESTPQQLAEELKLYRSRSPGKGNLEDEEDSTA